MGPICTRRRPPWGSGSPVRTRSLGRVVSTGRPTPPTVVGVVGKVPEPSGRTVLGVFRNLFRVKTKVLVNCGPGPSLVNRDSRPCEPSLSTGRNPRPSTRYALRSDLTRSSGEPHECFVPEGPEWKSIRLSDPPWTPRV